LATRPEVLARVLGIVYLTISGYLIRKAGLSRASAATGAVTLIQRSGSALNLMSSSTCRVSTACRAGRV
jgi:hypothetical protein